MPTDMTALRDDPVRYTTDAKRELTTDARDDQYARRWLLWELSLELQKYFFEYYYIDLESDALSSALKTFGELDASSDWVHPKLSRYLVACKRTAELGALPSRHVPLNVRHNGTAFTLNGRVPLADPRHARVSKKDSVKYITVLEETLAHPAYCAQMVDAFAHHLSQLVAAHGVTHLCFVEKEFGPVGALLLFAPLVTATKLPACIFRETHLAQRSAIAGQPPQASARVAVVYDLVVSGSGIRHVAEALQERGATTVAAQVMFSFAKKGEPIAYNSGAQTIHLSSLAYYDDLTSEIDALFSETRGIRGASETMHATEGVRSQGALQERTLAGTLSTPAELQPTETAIPGSGGGAVHHPVSSSEEQTEMSVSRPFDEGILNAILAAEKQSRKQAPEFLKDHPEFDGFLENLVRTYQWHVFPIGTDPLARARVTVQEAYEHIFATPHNRCEKCRHEFADTIICSGHTIYNPGELGDRARNILRALDYQDNSVGGWEPRERLLP
jgi:orotate phosphoribosyltransferase